MRHTRRSCPVARPRRMLALLLGGLILTGCDAPQSAESQDMLAFYAAGEYRAAQRAAEAELPGASEPVRSNARYIAGMSAYQLARDDIAIRHLDLLTRHEDDALSGAALATLGLIYESRYQDTKAIDCMKRAADRLTSEDKAQAYYHLGMLHQNIGQWARARNYFSLANSNSTDAALQSAVEQDRHATAFTLQMGAYANRELAMRRAEGLAGTARAARLPRPGVVRSVGTDQRTLYLIQTGTFREHAQARAARKRLNEPDVFIARLFENRLSSN